MIGRTRKAIFIGGNLHRCGKGLGNFGEIIGRGIYATHWFWGMVVNLTALELSESDFKKWHVKRND